MDDKIVTLSIGGGGRQTSNFIKDIKNNTNQIINTYLQEYKNML